MESSKGQLVFNDRGGWSLIQKVFVLFWFHSGKKHSTQKTCSGTMHRILPAPEKCVSDWCWVQTEPNAQAKQKVGLVGMQWHNNFQWIYFLNVNSNTDPHQSSLKIRKNVPNPRISVSLWPGRGWGGSVFKQHIDCLQHLTCHPIDQIFAVPTSEKDNGHILWPPLFSGSNLPGIDTNGIHRSSEIFGHSCVVCNARRRPLT